MCAERIAPPDRMAALRRAVAALKVFPLHGVVVLPGTPAPFHVFEPRYKALLGDALRPPIRAICGVGVVEAEERHDDGRYDIVLRGLARVRLLEELPPTKLYREFKAEILEDVLPPGGARALQGELEGLRQLVYELSTRLPKESGATQLAEAVAQMKEPSAIVDLVAAAAVSDADARQSVLEELHVGRRLQLVMEEVAGVVLVLSRGNKPSA